MNAVATKSPQNFTDLLSAVQGVFLNGSSFEDYKQTRDWFLSNENRVMELTSKLTIPQLNRYVYKSSKPRMVRSVADALMQSFVMGTFSYSPMQEGYAEAIRRITNSYTEADFLAYKEKKAAKAAERQKALTNPETLEEFRTFINHFGEAKLTSEQRERHDELMTGTIKANKEKDAERTAQVTAVAVEDVDLLIKETIHTKKLHKLWVVQLSDRVDRPIFNELHDRAKQLGGYYSSFRGNGAIPGFTFDRKEAAELFVQIKDTDVNAHELRKAINAEKQQARAERLEEKAENMEARASEEMNRDRKDNTHRRAAIATSIERRAAQEIEFALTMDAIAERMKSEELVHLNRLGTIAQLDELENILYQCRSAYMNDKNIPYMQREGIGYTAEMVDYAKMPFPELYKESHTETLLHRLAEDNGKRLAAVRMSKRLLAVKEMESIVIKESHSMKDYERLFLWPSKNLDSWAKDRFKAMHLRYRRVTSLGITTIFELRCALRELIKIKQLVKLTPEQQKMQQIRELERKFIGLKIDGFFPITEALASKSVELAKIEPGNKICEPSAGLGHLAETILELHPDADLQCVEINQRLHEALTLKGFSSLNDNFLEHSERYDRIIMNPPFENNQDIDHVLHAYSLLNSGGRIVATMAGNKGKDNKKVREFMEFVDMFGSWYENPEGSFISAFRPTGVNTITVILDKP